MATTNNKTTTKEEEAADMETEHGLVGARQEPIRFMHIRDVAGPQPNAILGTIAMQREGCNVKVSLAIVREGSNDIPNRKLGITISGGRLRKNLCAILPFTTELMLALESLSAIDRGLALNALRFEVLDQLTRSGSWPIRIHKALGKKDDTLPKRTTANLRIRCALIRLRDSID